MLRFLLPIPFLCSCAGYDTTVGADYTMKTGEKIGATVRVAKLSDHSKEIKPVIKEQPKTEVKK